MAGTVSRRAFLRLGAGVGGAAGLAAPLGGCGSAEQERGLVMLSTQLRPAAEAQALRDGVLAGLDRPVSFVPLDGTLEARVEVVEPIGSQLLVTSRTGDQELKLLTPTDFQVAPGDRLWLRPDLDRAGWFDPASGARLDGG